MAQPLFSIIVPVYKAEKYLRQCVDSILGQTLSDFELILVDDGSPDGSGAICDEYARKDGRVKVIHKENGGNVSARRAGHEVCTGNYLVHVDSDDYIDPRLLETVAQHIRTHGVDAVLFGYTPVSPEGTPGTPRPQGAEPGLYKGQDMCRLRRQLIWGEDERCIFYNLWSMVIRRELFLPRLQAVPENIYRGEDLAATAPTLCACQAVAVLDSYLYFYRQTPGSIMNTFRGDEAEQAVLLAQYLTQKLGEEFRSRLDDYVMAEFYPCLKQLAMENSFGDYRRKLKTLATPALRQRLRGARCSRHAHFTNKLMYFVLRHGWFALFYAIATRRR